MMVRRLYRLDRWNAVVERDLGELAAHLRPGMTVKVIVYSPLTGYVDVEVFGNLSRPPVQGNLPLWVLHAYFKPEVHCGKTPTDN